jgi:hypothetical protein
VVILSSTETGQEPEKLTYVRAALLHGRNSGNAGRFEVQLGLGVAGAKDPEPADDRKRITPAHRKVVHRQSTNPTGEGDGVEFGEGHRYVSTTIFARNA